VERAQVVVDADREPHPPDAPHRVGLGRRTGAEDHAVRRRLDNRDVDRRAVVVEQALDRGAAAAGEAVGRAAGQAERPWRSDLDAQLHRWCLTGSGGRSPLAWSRFQRLLRH
jgi:hypothetical protein